MKSSPENYTGLERDIAALKTFAKPLSEEVVVTPLLDVVARIIDLPDELNELPHHVLASIEREVTECKRLLEQLSYHYVSQIISRPQPSKVFRVLANANAFSAELKSMQGRRLKSPDGQTEIEVTPKLIEALTLYRFSIGTPPITPEGIKTIEKILFGGELTDIYAFRDLLGGDKVLFDRFLSGIDQLVSQSTHYTTDAEKKKFERRATEFPGLEGLRGFKKVALNGGVKSVVRIMKEQLLSQHQNGSLPLKVVETKNGLDENLLDAMNKDRQSLFVVRASQVPYNTFTTDRLKPEWYGIIGRLVIVDDTENAHKSATTLVYSLHPGVIESLEKFAVKDSGTVANTQLNLRLLVENFKAADLEDLTKRTNVKIAQLEAEGVCSSSVDDVRKKEWLLTAQKDYVSLKKFIRFLTFVKKIKEGDAEAMEELNAELEGEVTEKTREYFFKNLGKEYKCISVPQGGGRRELGHVGRFYYERSRAGLEGFRSNKLQLLKARLAALKAKQQVGQDGTSAESSALQRALSQTASPSAGIQSLQIEGQPAPLRGFLRAQISEAIHGGALRAGEVLEGARATVDKALAANPTGRLKANISGHLGKLGLGSLSKQMERGVPRQAGNLARSALGTVHRVLSGALETGENKLSQLRHEMEPTDLDLVERMLTEIETGTFRPNLALPEMRWSFNDVLDDVRFPTRNYLKITVDDQGELNPDSLGEKLEILRISLAEFPELFELYCQNTLLIINDPHNPTSRVAHNETKLKLLDIASRYGLTILADEAYHKQVTKTVKEEQGDFSLAEFYEINRSRFPRPITIFSSLPSTKWAMGAGRRTGVLLTNDNSQLNGNLTFEQFVQQGTDGVNTMSLFLDHESLSTGLMVKKVCKALEEAILSGNGTGTIDALLTKYFQDPAADDFCAPVYFSLLEARNDLDRLSIRGANPLEIRRFLSDLVSRLKNLRLDKQTQRDSAERSKAVTQAVRELSAEYPGLDKRFIQPEGPFYFCVKLDDGPSDPDLLPFLEAIARARKVDAVPVEKGYVRFAFGGAVDNTKEGYLLLKKAISTDLRILLTYWQRFKDTRARLHEAKDLNPVPNSIKEIFPGGEADLAATIHEKGDLIKSLRDYGSTGRGRLTQQYPPSVSGYLSSIEPGSPASIVTINEVSCKRVEDFVASKAFKDIFNYYLLQVSGSIVAMQGMEPPEILAQYGAHRFIDKFKTRDFTDIKKEITEEIVLKIAKIWFSDNTIKILGLKFDQHLDAVSGADALMGAERRIYGFIKQFIQAFLSPEKESEIAFKPTFQVGYEVVEGVQADPTLPQWLKVLVGKAQFAGQTVPTDPAPEMVTGGAARVPGYSRGIYKRDGNGEDLPTAAHFSRRLQEFAEELNPKDYVCKMAQIGPTRLMLVMHRSYTHYMAEELRLLPQFDVSIDDLDNLKPDAISFLGIPTKVMGEDYRIGYFFDQAEDGTQIPVSWVDCEEITNYVGYLKKPLLTMGNEKVKEIGGLPIHGSAFTIEAKNGLRKTVVMAGDSGTGKSETIIAMVEQIIEGFGGAANIKSVDLLSGDMLSLFEGEDGQIYMLGTESGDFMRMTDISDSWRDTFRDRIETASKTNKTHPTNPRTTIGGLCDQDVFLRPVRVNMFININNFETPSGSAFQEIENPHTLMRDIYPRGYRREKGTSGDQPNLFASVYYGQTPDKSQVLSKYGEGLDTLLGWNVIIGEGGKAENATLKFNDVPGEIFRALNMVKDLFKGKIIKETPAKAGESKKEKKAAFRISEEGATAWEVRDVSYDCRENCFYLELQDSENSKSARHPINRNIFDRVYNPIASTYCGNPFIDPRGMGEVLARFAESMKSSGVITGQVYTQLAVRGREFSGPAQAAQHTIAFIQGDPRINERFQKNRAKVSAGLLKKYGTIIGQDALPEALEAHNLLLLERQESDVIHLVDKDKKTIPLKTPFFKNQKAESGAQFNPSLLTPEMYQAIKDVSENPDNLRNLESFAPDLSLYEKIITWDSQEELIYQILLCNGMLRLGDKEGHGYSWIEEVMKAKKMANLILEQRASRAA